MIYSIKNEASNEIVINKSRFITILKKVNNEDEIKVIMNGIKDEYKNATHYCYAFIIDNIKRFSDDNEPTGTAGLPILDILDKNNLNNVLCIVIRYFGGIKLGSGGLIRAYSKSAREVLKLAEVVKLTKGKTIKVTFNYNDLKVIDNILKSYYIKVKEFNEVITYTIEVKLEDLNDIKEQLQNINDIKINELDNILIDNR